MGKAFIFCCRGLTAIRFGLELLLLEEDDKLLLPLKTPLMVVKFELCPPLDVLELVLPPPPPFICCWFTYELCADDAMDLGVKLDVD